MRIDRTSGRPEDPGEGDGPSMPERPAQEAQPRTWEIRDDNGLNAAEYIAAWNKKVEAGEADREEAAEERPRRDPSMRDSNGMTAAELRFLRNKQIDEAESKTSEADGPVIEPTSRRSVVTDAQGRTSAEMRFQETKRAEEGAKAKAGAEAGADNPEAVSESDGNAAEELPDALRAARDQPKEYAGRRAAELQGQVPENSRGWITMGVGVGTDGDGATRVVVGTSEARGYLREGVTLQPGEERSREPGHAEVSILAYMAGRDIEPSHVAAGRPICSPCADSIDAAGADPASPLKQPREDPR